jgi:hypothetical protein
MRTPSQKTKQNENQNQNTGNSKSFRISVRDQGPRPTVFYILPQRPVTPIIITCPLTWGGARNWGCGSVVKHLPNIVKALHPSPSSAGAWRVQSTGAIGLDWAPALGPTDYTKMELLMLNEVLPSRIKLSYLTLLEVRRVTDNSQTPDRPVLASMIRKCLLS